MVQLVVHHKWFIRAGLATFWVVEIIAYAFNRGFITHLLEKHTWWSLIIIFLSFKYLVEPFYAPFCTLKTVGGDAVMERSTKIMLLIVAVLASVLTVMFVSPGAREAIITGVNNSVAKPLMVQWLGFVDWLDTQRGIYLLGSGLVSGLILAIIINQVALPKIRGGVKKLPKPYMGAPEYVPPSVIPPAKTTQTTNSEPIVQPKETKQETPE